MTRKRGAPPGNQNALRHGFYTSRFKRHELHALSHSNSLELADEIALIRVATARLLDALDSQEARRDLRTELSVFRALNLGVGSIRALLRTRLTLARDSWSLSPGMQQHERGHLTAPEPGRPHTGTVPGA